MGEDQTIGCPTCDTTVHGNGSVTHAQGCVTEDLKKHRHALHKIGHILKEIGITALEVSAEVVTGGGPGVPR